MSSFGTSKTQLINLFLTSLILFLLSILLWKSFSAPRDSEDVFKKSAILPAGKADDGTGSQVSDTTVKSTENVENPPQLGADEDNAPLLGSDTENPTKGGTEDVTDNDTKGTPAGGATAGGPTATSSPASPPGVSDEKD
jgi:hypothetical protein